MDKKEVKLLAEKNGLLISEEMTFSEIGLDFQVAFARKPNEFR